MFQCAVERRKGNEWLRCWARLSPGVLKFYGAFETAATKCDATPEESISLIELCAAQPVAPNGVRLLVAAADAAPFNISLEAAIPRTRLVDLRCPTAKTAENLLEHLRHERERLLFNERRYHQGMACSSSCHDPAKKKKSSSQGNLEGTKQKSEQADEPVMGPRTLRLLSNMLRETLVAVCESGGVAALVADGGKPSANTKTLRASPRSPHSARGKKEEVGKNVSGMSIDAFVELLSESTSKGTAKESVHPAKEENNFRRSSVLQSATSEGTAAAALQLGSQAFFDLAGFSVKDSPNPKVLLRRLALGSLLLTLAEAGATVRALYLWLGASGGYTRRLSEVCEDPLGLSAREALALTALCQPLPKGLESLAAGVMRCAQSRLGRSIPYALHTQRTIRAAIAIVAPADHVGHSPNKGLIDANAITAGAWLRRQFLLHEALLDPADPEACAQVQLRAVDVIEEADSKSTVSIDPKQGLTSGLRGLAGPPSKAKSLDPSVRRSIFMRAARLCSRSLLHHQGTQMGNSGSLWRRRSSVITPPAVQDEKGLEPKGAGLEPDGLRCQDVQLWLQDELSQAAADRTRRGRLCVAIVPDEVTTAATSLCPLALAVKEADGKAAEPGTVLAQTNSVYVVELHEPEMNKYVVRAAWRNLKDSAEDIEAVEQIGWSSSLPLEEFMRILEQAASQPPSVLSSSDDTRRKSLLNDGNETTASHLGLMNFSKNFTRKPSQTPVPELQIHSAVDADHHEHRNNSKRPSALVTKPVMGKHLSSDHGSKAPRASEVQPGQKPPASPRGYPTKDPAAKKGLAPKGHGKEQSQRASFRGSVQPPDTHDRTDSAGKGEGPSAHPEAHQEGTHSAGKDEDTGNPSPRRRTSVLTATTASQAQKTKDLANSKTVATKLQESTKDNDKDDAEKSEKTTKNFAKLRLYTKLGRGLMAGKSEGGEASATGASENIGSPRTTIGGRQARGKASNAPTSTNEPASAEEIPLDSDEPQASGSSPGKGHGKQAPKARSDKVPGTKSSGLRSFKKSADDSVSNAGNRCPSEPEPQPPPQDPAGP